MNFVKDRHVNGLKQARIQVFGLEGAKFGEGSGDRLGPSQVQGRALVGDQGGEGPRPPEAPAIKRF